MSCSYVQSTSDKRVKPLVKAEFVTMAVAHNVTKVILSRYCTVVERKQGLNYKESD